MLFQLSQPGDPGLDYTLKAKGNVEVKSKKENQGSNVMTLHLFWVMDHYENLVKRLSSEKNAHIHTQICILMWENQRLFEPSLALLYPKIEAVLDFCQVNSFQLSVWESEMIQY